MALENYDVAVIGGGIHGAGVAQCAAVNGLKTLLLETNHWASATSSASSKLIHGGLRYLESGQLHLVRHCLEERALLMKLAPELVKPSQFVIPLYRHSQRRSMHLKIGLQLYRTLAGFGPHSDFQQLACNDEVIEQSGIKQDQLEAVYQYWDAQTDDKLLTEAVIQSAQEYGAECYQHSHFLRASRKLNQYQITYRQQQREQRCQTRFIVNASGPWANQTLAKILPEPANINLSLIQGSHLLLEGRISEKIFYLEAPQDQRAIFVMPWHKQTLLGTTETPYSGAPENCRTTEQERHYLQQVLGHYFPHFEQRIVDEMCGIRVLPGGSGSAFNKPRETQLIKHQRHPNLVSIIGGKLTSYRWVAEQVVKPLLPSLKNHHQYMSTAHISLSHPQVLQL